MDYEKFLPIVQGVVDDIKDLKKIVSTIPDLKVATEKLSTAVTGNGNKEFSLMGIVTQIKTDLKNIGDLAREAKQDAEEAKRVIDGHISDHKESKNDDKDKRSLVAVWVSIAVTFLFSVAGFVLQLVSRGP